MNNNIDIANESLESVLLKKYGKCLPENTDYNRQHNTIREQQINSFIDGTNYQKEKDKAIIDNLREGLKYLLLSHYKLSGGLIPTKEEENTEQLLKSIEQDT